MDMNMKNFDLEEALRAGADPEKMASDFAMQLAKAKVKIDKEKKAVEEAHTIAKTEKINAARKKMVDSMVEYLALLDLIPEDIMNDSEVVNGVENMFKELEDEMDELKPLFDCLDKLLDKSNEEKDVDSILEAFVRTL